MLIIAIAMASVIVNAQTEPAAAPATAPAATEQVTTEAPAAPAKKAAKKAKKVKKAKPSAKAPAAAPVAPVVTAPAVEAAPVAAPATTMAPAAGTSTATAAAPAADAKKWGVTAQVLSSNYALSQGDIQTLTSIAASYKITDKIKIKAKQTFETLSAGPDLSNDPQKREMIESNNFRPTFADFSVSSTLPGFLGSNELPVSLNYKYITGDAIYTQLGGYAGAHAMVEGNLSIPYTLSPKWELSIDTQIRHVVAKAGDNTHRVLAIPSLSYAVNDMINVYQAAGLIYSFDRNERFRNVYQRSYLATGVSVVPVKNLTLDVNVSQDKAIFVTSDKDYDVTNYSLYNPNVSEKGQDRTFDFVAYEGSLTYSF